MRFDTKQLLERLTLALGVAAWASHSLPLSRGQAATRSLPVMTGGHRRRPQLEPPVLKCWRIGSGDAACALELPCLHHLNMRACDWLPRASSGTSPSPCPIKDDSIFSTVAEAANCALAPPCLTGRDAQRSSAFARFVVPGQTPRCRQRSSMSCRCSATVGCVVAAASCHQSQATLSNVTR